MVLRNPPYGRNQHYALEGLNSNPHLKWGCVTYVITPLIESGCAIAEVSGGVLRLVMTGKRFVRVFSKANEVISNRS